MRRRSLLKVYRISGFSASNNPNLNCIQVDDTTYSNTNWTNIDSVAFDSISYNILTGPAWISRSWIDSDSAMFLAELQGGTEFRALNPDYRIKASLSEALVPSSFPKWYITYISNENPNNKKLIIIDATDSPTYVPSLKDNTNSLENYVLSQNHPNPFNSSTEIRYSLPQTKSSWQVTIKIYDIRGRLIKILISQNQSAGSYFVRWHGKDMQGNAVASEVYFYTLQVGEFKVSKKMLLLE